MRRLVAALVIVVFATLLAADALACPDGCQSCDTPAGADPCNNTGACLICVRGLVSVTATPDLAPFVTELPAPISVPLLPSTFDASVPHQPPRLA